MAVNDKLESFPREETKKRRINFVPYVFERTSQVSGDEARGFELNEVIWCNDDVIG
jgi:hypothetical protein